VRFKIALLVVLAATLVSLPASALGKSAHTAAGSQSFTDSTGEDANAPDITTVAVSNDDAGLMTFKINISNRPALTTDMIILMFLDTDANSATGDPQTAGADYAIQLEPGAVGLFQWNGSDFTQASSQASVTFSYDATGATIHASAADLGKTKSVRFAVLAVSGIVLDANGNPDFTNAHEDSAPDPGHGLFTYPVLTKLTLSVTAFTTAPKPAKAGKRYVASLAANESDTGGPVTAGTVTCAATIGTTRLAATAHSLAGGVATCAWKIPKTAKGKTLRGTVTLVVQGVKVTRPFSSKIA
jgi:hypothetical protein